tara:strand:- start:4807 stop:5382 length:576 start_codon:yes stop_codon:yes gene_type:complete
MKLGLKQIILLFVIAFSSFAFKAELLQIKGWSMGGSDKSLYEIGVVNDNERKGKVAYIKSIKPKIKDKFGTIMQAFSADNYLGKKMRLTGYIKTKDVNGWVGMWMRVDGQKKHSLSFDNMGDRKIKGTTGWTKYEIVLDVPKSSTRINYGVLLSQTGEAWLDDLQFEEVSKETTSTGKNLSMKPSNTSFEE